jgi:hypothetical protein
VKESGLSRILEHEARRTSRTGSPFTVLRIGPPALTDLEEILRLGGLVEGVLRKTDVVFQAGGEIVAMLIDTAEHHAPAAMERLDAAFREARLRFVPRIASASIGPRHEPSWEKAWRMAGALLVASTAAA